MDWEPVETRGGGTWQVNRGGLYAVIRGAELWTRANKAARIVPEERSLFDMLWAPYIENVQVDMKKVAADADRAADAFFESVMRDLPNQPENAFNNLRIILEEANKGREMFHARNNNVMAVNKARIDAKVESHGNVIEGAKITRDVSITVFFVLAVSASGGAAALATGGIKAQSTLIGLKALEASVNGLAKYQDTGRVERALLHSSTSFVVSMVGVTGANMGGNPYAVVALEAGTDGMFTGTEALIEGKSADAAIRMAFTKAGLSALLGSVETRFAIDRMAVPVQVAFHTGKGVTTAVGGKLAESSKPSFSGKTTRAGLPTQKQQNEAFLREHVLRSV